MITQSGDFISNNNDSPLENTRRMERGQTVPSFMIY